MQALQELSGVTEEQEDEQAQYCVAAGERVLEARRRAATVWSCCNESVELAGIPPAADEPPPPTSDEF